MANVTSNELDLVWGADGIAKAINVSRRRAFYLLESGHLPAKKIGGRWCASVSALRRRFAELLCDEAA